MELADLANRTRGTNWIKLNEIFQARCPIDNGLITVRLLQGKPFARCDKGCKSPKIIEALEGAEPSGAPATLPARHPGSSNKVKTSDFGSANREASPRPETDDILRRIPPQNLEAEQCVLGAILLDNEALSVARQMLSPDQFYRDAHRELFRTMIELADVGKAIDAITMKQRLRDSGSLERIGGGAYIAELAVIVPTSSNIRYYAEIVRDMAVKRNVATAATELASMAYNGVSANALLGEMGRRFALLDNAADQATLPAAFVRKEIEILTWDQLRIRRQSHVENWAVEGWLALGEISMWSGKVEHGKTTLMRELTLCKARGEAFLGRPCPKGRVFYAMLDADGENLTYDEFEKMGMNEDDRENVRFLFEPMLARMKGGPEQFFRELYDWKPGIVIIDPFARLQEIADFNDYNNTYLMAMLSQYAKNLNAHFALPGHIPRGRPQGSGAATAAFGSIAFGGGVNARFVVERKEGTDIHVLRTSKGKSAGFQAFEGDHVLERDFVTGRITLGKAFSFGHQAAAIKGRVLELIQGTTVQEWTPAAIAKEIGSATGLVRAALGMLFDDQKITRTGSGKKGNPFAYSKLSDDEKMPAVDLNQNRMFPD